MTAATFQDALKAFQAEDFRLCAQLLKPLVAASDADPTALLIAAQCHVKLGDGDRASGFYSRLADAQPSNRETFLKLASEASALSKEQPEDIRSALSPGFLDQLIESMPPQDPISAQIHNLFQRRDFAGAATAFDEAVAAKTLQNPSIATVAVVSHCNEQLGETEKAAHQLCHAALAPSLHQIRLLRAALPLLQDLLIEKSGIPDIGYEAAKRLVALEPRNLDAAFYYRYAMHATCAIEDQRAYNAAALAGLQRGDSFYAESEVLHSHLFWCADEALNARIKNHGIAIPFTSQTQAARRNKTHKRADKIRIGYLTADLYAEHPTSLLFKGVLESHDRAAFDISLYCYTPGPFKDSDIEFRRSLPNLIDIKGLNDKEAVSLIKSHGIDILVDLKGPTSNARSGILNLGGAPVQVAWLGFPGSGTGVDCDYIIGDKVVTPASSAPFYHEKFCRLPESYQCNDGFTRPLPSPLQKADLGISEDTFVFASYNSMNKLSPQIIDLWAEILSRVADSKLALFSSHKKQIQNFLNAMAKKGLNTDRFIFLPRASYREHLARIPAADLGLDCYPCNGHTTTSDMLWMGLPLLTFRGSNFASRVSESLLTAIGLEELVADDAAAFVERAVSLATESETLETMRRQLAENRFLAPLFDTERFTRHLEAGFKMMIDRHGKGLAPEHIDVAPLPSRRAPFR